MAAAAPKSEAHRKQFLHPEDDDEEEEKNGAKGGAGDAKKSVESKPDTPKKVPPKPKVRTLVKMGGPPNPAASTSTDDADGDVNMSDKEDDDDEKMDVLLAQKYVEGSINPKGWWMSEKLDGVRAFWNGRGFYSRRGNAFIAPEWFTKDLPTKMHLDGELFGGRGKFQSTVSIVKTPDDKRWENIKYHVFDAPNLGKGKETFEKRYEEMQTYFNKSLPKYAILCEQTECQGQDHIDEELPKVLALGGEGLMLRQPNSLYEKRRSPTLLKIKKFHDAEAVVIAHEKGKAGKKNQHVTGALRCRMECGKEFSVGSGLTDAQRKKPPKIGAIITYRFQEYTNSGSPRFPTFVGIRIDADGPKDADIPKNPTDD